ncbi:uncharacterized protein LOC113647597 [Tachysurus ichikawai]
MDTGEKVVSIAEDNGSGLDTTHGVTGNDALSGMEDATVVTLGDGVVEEDGTSGVTAGIGRTEKGTLHNAWQIKNGHRGSWMSFHPAVTAVVYQPLQWPIYTAIQGLQLMGTVWGE